jgi:hypothetical protein
MSSDHNPPSMMAWPPGVYEHTCSACGYKTIFTVYGNYCETIPRGNSWVHHGPAPDVRWGNTAIHKYDPSKNATFC